MEILPGKADNLEDILHLYREFRGDGWTADRLPEALETYPSIVAYDEGHLIGFAYTYNFAPDLLELANIYVSPAHRDNRLGTKLLQEIEQECAMRGICGLIACNSFLYETIGKKSSPETFYIRNGYKVAAFTPDTKIFIKIFE